MIIIKNLNKTYITKKKKEVKALIDVSLTLPDKGLVFILGKSGSGKTTLLNILGCLDTFDSGDVLVDGRSIKDFKQKELDDYRNTFLGFVFQEMNLIENFNVRQNIELALSLQNKKEENNSIATLLEELELKDIETKLPKELSGGQKQRVAIARALIKNPKLILADEPTGSLDEETGEKILNILKEKAKKRLVVVVSHNKSFAKEFADQIIKIKNGKIVENNFNSTLVITNDKEDGSFDKNEKLIKSKLSPINSIKIGLHYIWCRKFRLLFTVLFSFLAFTVFSTSLVLSTYSPTNSIYDYLLTRENRNFAISYNELDDKADGYASEKITQETKDYFETNFNVKSDGLFNFNRSLNSSRDFASYQGRIEAASQPMDSLSISSQRLNELNFTMLCGSLPSTAEEIALTDFHFYVLQHLGFKDFTNHEFPKVILKEDIISPDNLLGKTVYSHGIYFTISGFIDTNTVSTYKDYLDYLFSLDINEFSKYKEENKLEYSFYQSEITSNYPNALYYSSAFENKVKDGQGFYSIKKGLSIERDEKYPDLIFDKFASTPLSDMNVSFLPGYDKIENDNQIIMPSSVKYRLLELDNTKELDSKDKTATFFEYQLNDRVWNKKENEITFDGPKDFYSRGKDAFILNYLLNNLPNSDLFKRYCNEFYFSEENSGYLQAISDEMEAFAYFSYLTNYIDYKEHLSEDLINLINKTSSNPFEELSLNYLDNLFNEYVYSKYMLNKKYTYSFNYRNVEDNMLSDDIQSYEFEVVGFFDDVNRSYENSLIVSENVFNQLIDKNPFTYSQLLVNFDNNNSALYRVLEDGYKEGVPFRFTLINPISSSLGFANMKLSYLKTTFFYLGLIVMAFATLLFCFLLYGVITSSLKQIAILRSIGARKSEIFKIFFVESLFVSTINFVLTSIATSLLIFYFNQTVINDYSLPINAYFFDWKNVLILLFICLFDAFIASLVPILYYTSKKPVDLLKAE